jgi:hypothetical protein
MNSQRITAMAVLVVSLGVLAAGAMALGIVDPIATSTGTRLARVARQVTTPSAPPAHVDVASAAQRIADLKLGPNPGAHLAVAPEVMVPGAYRDIGICPPEGGPPDGKVCVTLDWKPMPGAATD